MQILQAAGDNFRRARTAKIHDDDDGNIFQFVTVALRKILVYDAPPLGGNHQLAARQKFLTDGHGLFEQPARIPPQIQNQPFHALLFQFAERGFKIIRRVVAELRQAHIADAGFAERKLLPAIDVLDHLHLDDGTLQSVIFFSRRWPVAPP